MFVTRGGSSPRRLLMSICSAIGVLAFVPATSAAAAAVMQDSVTGSVSSSFCGGQLSINAQSGPNGESPSGQVTCGDVFQRARHMSQRSGQHRRTIGRTDTSVRAGSPEGYGQRPIRSGHC
jgi:hypothetical protein